jgi:hypothetical protein
MVLPDGIFFPSGRRDVPWGHARGPAGVAPEALEECVHSCKVFCIERPVREAFVLAGFDIISAGLGNATHAYRQLLTVRRVQKV